MKRSYLLKYIYEVYDVRAVCTQKLDLKVFRNIKPVMAHVGR